MRTRGRRECKRKAWLAKAIWEDRLGRLGNESRSTRGYATLEYDSRRRNDDMEDAQPEIDGTSSFTGGSLNHSSEIFELYDSVQRFPNSSLGISSRLDQWL